LIAAAGPVSARRVERDRLLGSVEAPDETNPSEAGAKNGQRHRLGHIGRQHAFDAKPGRTAIVLHEEVYRVDAVDEAAGDREAAESVVAATRLSGRNSVDQDVNAGVVGRPLTG
jgi:hypothetical protein